MQVSRTDICIFVGEDGTSEKTVHQIHYYEGGVGLVACTA